MHLFIQAEFLGDVFKCFAIAKKGDAKVFEILFFGLAGGALLNGRASLYHGMSKVGKFDALLDS